MSSRPIVVGADGSKESLRAVEWAAREAKRRGSPLRIVTAPAMPRRMRTHEPPPVTVANALRGIAVRALGEAVTRAEEIAPGLLVDTDLLAMHARGGLGDHDKISAKVSRQLAGTLDVWRDKYPDVRIRQKVVSGRPAWVLSDYSAIADLVVLGRHDSRRGTVRAVGSVQHTLLNHAHGPIAVVPPNS